MYDLQKIGKVMADIEGYLREIEEYNIRESSELENVTKYRAVSMSIFALLNRVIDLGTAILAYEQVGAPGGNMDVIPLLSKAGIINKEQADNINKLIKKRNDMAHFYYGFDKKDLFDLIKKIHLISDLVKIIKKRLNKVKEKK